MGKKPHNSAFSQSVSPNQNYVFYEHLRTDESNAKLANQVTTNYTNAFSAKPQQPDISIVQKLKTMAENERKKEQGFIKYTFGVDINYDLDYHNTKDFIDAFNSYMQLQNVYRARKVLLMQGFDEDVPQKNKKDTYSFFSSYFSTVWKSHTTEIYDKIMDNIKANPKSNWTEIVSSTINNMLPNLVEETLQKVENANHGEGLASKKQQKQIMGAMKEISKSIDQLGRTQFGKMIISALNLNSISKHIIENLRIDNFNGTIKKEKMQEILTNSVKFQDSGVNIQGGVMLELVEGAVFNVIAKNLKSSRGINIEMFHTGQSGAKADNVMVVSKGEITTQTKQIKEIFDSVNRSQSRQENIDMTDKIQNVLDKGKTTGYIVYSSDKNHFMVRQNKKGISEEVGFEAGAMQKLSLFEPILNRAVNNGGKSEALIQGIMQTIPGAIGASDKGQMEDKLAEYFAYFLFDDLDFIGKESVGTSSMTQIHLTYLNGVYVPLSVLLSLYAQALNNELNKVISSPKSIANVKISTPKKIEFNYADPNFAPPKGAWAIQREKALNSIKVGLEFLQSLRTILSDFQQ